MEDVSSPQKKPRVCEGLANAARVSLGSEYDVWDGLSVEDPARHASEHITITVVIYNTVVAGVPSKADVIAAIDDLEALYAASTVQGHLADDQFDFMKEELTSEDLRDITFKVATQPYTPPPICVLDHDVFPAEDE